MYYRLVALRRSEKFHILTSLLLSSICAVLLLVALPLHNWFEYCFWEFGLVYATSLVDIHAFRHEDSIKEVHSDACGDLEAVVDDYCSGICHDLKKFSAAGGVMLAFGLMALLVLLFHSGVLVKKYWSPRFHWKYFYITVAFPLVAFTCGYFLYLIIIDPADLDKPSNKHRDFSTYHPKSFSIKSGNGLAISLVLLFGLQCAHGFFFTRSLFKP